MKQLIVTVIGVAFGALVLGFWIAPGWMEGVMLMLLDCRPPRTDTTLVT